MTMNKDDFTTNASWIWTDAPGGPDAWWMFRRGVSGPIVS